MTMRALVLVAALGCGGSQRPAGPPPFDAEALATELATEMAELAAIVHTHRADCPRMAAAMRALFPRMEASLERARQAQKDPERARQLTSAMRTYDQRTAEHMASIEADFTADSTCARDERVREVLSTMPTL